MKEIFVGERLDVKVIMWTLPWHRTLCFLHTLFSPSYILKKPVGKEGKKKLVVFAWMYSFFALLNISQGVLTIILLLLILRLFHSQIL